MAGRRHASWTAAATLLLTLATLLPAPPAGARSAHDRLTETRRRLRATRARIADLRRTDAELLAVIAGISGELATTRRSLARAHGRLGLLQLRIRGTARRIARLEALRTARTAQIGARARELYILGPGARFEAVMGAGTFDDFVDRASTIDFVVRFDRAVIQDIARIVHGQRTARRELLARKAEALEVRREIADRAAVVSEVLTTKRAAEDALSQRIADFLTEARALEAEQERILNLIRSRQSTSVGPISTRGFAWPIRGRITSGYGPRWGGFHTGIDIDCGGGERIKASKGGRVIAAEWGGGYGRMVIVDHGNGVSTLYAHLSRIYTGEGARVDRGAGVGACGSSGNATGTHLHFEVRVNGHHRNPMHFLP